MAKTKPRVIKNYEKLDEKLREAIAARYPQGYAQEIQTFDIGGGRFMTGLPFETDEFSYIIKFPAVAENLSDLEDAEGAADDELNLDGAVDVEEEEEPDEVEKPTDIEDIDVADESTTEN
ncbi:MAG: hypothetical protein ACI35Q_03475 [Marinilabiliaceae bacterium]